MDILLLAEKTLPKTTKTIKNNIKNLFPKSKEEFKEMAKDSSKRKKMVKKLQNIYDKSVRMAIKESINNKKLEKLIGKNRLQKITNKVESEAKSAPSKERLLDNLSIPEKTMVCLGLLVIVGFINSILMTMGLYIVLNKSDISLFPSEKEIEEFNEKYGKIAGIIAPFTEEITRYLCEKYMTNGAIIFSALISTLEAINAFRQILGSPKIKKKVKALIIGRTPGTAFHMLAGFVYKISRKYFGKAARWGSLVLMMILHGIFNAYLAIKIEKIIISKTT